MHKTNTGKLRSGKTGQRLGNSRNDTLVTSQVVFCFVFVFASKHSRHGTGETRDQKPRSLDKSKTKTTPKSNNNNKTPPNHKTRKTTKVCFFQPRTRKRTPCQTENIYIINVQLQPNTKEKLSPTLVHTRRFSMGNLAFHPNQTVTRQDTETPHQSSVGKAMWGDFFLISTWV